MARIAIDYTSKALLVPWDGDKTLVVCPALPGKSAVRAEVWRGDVCEEMYEITGGKVTHRLAKREREAK